MPELTACPALKSPLKEEIGVGVLVIVCGVLARTRSWGENETSKVVTQ
jgi:hypothetical protein